VSGNKEVTIRIGRVLALVGGIYGGVLAIGTAFRQLDLGAVLQGKMSLGVAFSLGGNALPVLVLLLCLCLTSIGLAIQEHQNLILTSIIWLVIGGVLLYGVYMARFSMGLLLLPSAGLILLASLLGAAQLFSKHIL